MIRFVSLVVLFLAVVPSKARADIIVDIQDVTISAGGSGFVDVLISSTGTDTLFQASYDLQISLFGPSVSTLQFTNPQILTETGLANYVFAGDANPIDVITLTNSQIVADAWTLSLNGVGLTTATRLLARLEIESVLGPGHTPALVDGEQFQISLVDSGNTLFLDDQFNPIAIAPASFTNSGLVTIQVPEPGSLGLCAIGGLMAGWRMRRHGSRNQSSLRGKAAT